MALITLRCKRPAVSKIDTTKTVEIMKQTKLSFLCKLLINAYYQDKVLLFIKLSLPVLHDECLKKTKYLYHVTVEILGFYEF